MTGIFKRTVIFIAVLTIIFSASAYIKNFKTEEATVDIVAEKTLIPGGQSIGVKMDVAGVLVVDLQGEAENSGIQVGDMIVALDETEVSNAQEVQRYVNKKRGPIEITVERKGKKKNFIIAPKKNDEDQKYRLGIWIKDKTAGIGTLTYYDSDNMTFGALGHPIVDNETQKMLDVETGELLSSKVIKIEAGRKGKPGEIQGIFARPSTPMGELKKNTEYGIFGTLNKKLKGKALPIASQSQVKEGTASILTTLDDNCVKEYKVKIEKVSKQKEPDTKSMIIRVTDKELLKKCGGIIQGMSGSPIIQNNRIVGAITHVFVEDPTRGYGIYIQWMLEKGNGK